MPDGWCVPVRAREMSAAIHAKFAPPVIGAQDLRLVRDRGGLRPGRRAAILAGGRGEQRDMSTRVFITGASRGIGLELARQYVAEGAQVFAAARAPGEAESLQRLAEASGGRLRPVALDVTDDGALPAAVDTVAREAGALDVLINNAGINPRHIGLGAYTSRAMLEALHINAVAPVLVGQAFLDLLRRGREPRVINMSSQVGSFRWNQRGMAPVYAASKAALNMYTRAFAREAAGIITVAVHPGWVQTDMGGGEAPLRVDEAVRQLRALIGRLSRSDNGQFLNYDGQPHPW